MNLQAKGAGSSLKTTNSENFLPGDGRKGCQMTEKKRKKEA